MSKSMEPYGPNNELKTRRNLTRKNVCDQRKRQAQHVHQQISNGQIGYKLVGKRSHPWRLTHHHKYGNVSQHSNKKYRTICNTEKKKIDFILIVTTEKKTYLRIMVANRLCLNWYLSCSVSKGTAKISSTLSAGVALTISS